MMAGSWPLVGRDNELDLVISAAGGRRASGAVITGEAGVGKTRLADEALELLGAHGHVIERVVGTAAGRDVPFGAFAHLVPDDHGALDLDALFQRVVADLRARARDSSKLILGVDDAQLLDDRSATLLHLLARHSEARLVLTVRNDEPVPPLIVELWKDGVLERIDLQPLARDTVGRLVDEATDARLRPETHDRIWRLSRGNPLFLRELIALAEETDDEREPLVISMATEPGRRLRELIEARVGGLDEDCRSGLEIVALGEPLPVAIAEQALDPGVLDVLERRGFVHLSTISGAPELRVAHPLHAEVLRQAMPGLRRRAILRRLARALTGTDDLGARHLLRIVTWRVEAGDPCGADDLIAAGHEAIARFDHARAERFARAAGSPAPFDAATLLATSLTGQGRPVEAEEVLSALEPSGPEHLAQVSVMRATNLFWSLGRAGEALELLRDTAESLREAHEQSAECNATRAMLLLFTGEIEAAHQMAEAVLRSDAAGMPARTNAAVVATVTLFATGAVDRSRSLGSDWLDVADRHRQDVPNAGLQLRANRLTALIWSGRLIEAQEYAERSFDLGSGPFPEGVLALTHGGRGWALAIRGHASASLVELDRAVQHLRRADWFGLRAWVSAGRARMAAFSNQPEVAAAAMREAEEAYAADPVRAAFSLPDTLITRAWLAAADGDHAGALGHARTVVALTRAAIKPLCADALLTIARLGEPGEAVEPLTELAGECEGSLVDRFAAFARALAGGEIDALLEVSKDLERLGVDLLAAEASWHAAVLHEQDGRSAAALGAQERARALLGRCGNPQVPTLPLAHIDISPAPLTDRELQVAMIAARGVTTRELAERLGISVRTAETHLSRVYRKLDVAGRNELAEAMRV